MAADYFPQGAFRARDTVMNRAPAKYLDQERVRWAKKRLEKGSKVRVPRGLLVS